MSWVKFANRFRPYDARVAAVLIYKMDDNCAKNVAISCLYINLHRMGDIVLASEAFLWDLHFSLVTIPINSVWRSFILN